jgi:hypothetical protein
MMMKNLVTMLQIQYIKIFVVYFCKGKDLLADKTYVSF